MNPHHHLLTLSLLASVSLACAPTDPGTTPRIPTSTTTTHAPTTTTTTTARPTTTTSPTTTTTLPPCCKVNIIIETGNRALFNPALNSCPLLANFVCSVMVDLAVLPNTIIINEERTVIANGENGQNSFAVLECRASDKNWVTMSGQIVNTISCISTP